MQTQNYPFPQQFFQPSPGTFGASPMHPNAFTPPPQMAVIGAMTPPPQFAPAPMMTGTTPPPQFAPAPMMMGTTPPPQFAPAPMMTGTTPPPSFAPPQLIGGMTPPPQFAPMSMPASRSQPPMPQPVMMPPASGAPSLAAPMFSNLGQPALQAPPPSKSQPPMKPQQRNTRPAGSKSSNSCDLVIAHAGIGQTEETAGVGLYFKIDKQARYFVEMVLPNTSAAATGVVKQGDILEGVQGQSVRNTTLGQLRDLILGPPGTTVNLSFLREMEVESFRFDVDLLRGDPNRMPKPSGEPLNRSVPPVPVPSTTPATTPADFSVPRKMAQMPAPAVQRAAAPPPLPPPPQADESDGEYRKKYLAEQRLHMEADREVQQLRAENTILKKEMERLSDSVRFGGGGGGDGDVVPREQLMEMEAKAQYLDEELQRQAMGREELVKLEVHARTIEEELRWYKEQQEDMVPRAQMLEAEARLRAMEEELAQQGQGGAPSLGAPRGGAGGPAEQVQQLSAMALPAVVSALHQLSQESGHASSATWALLRAEDYIAHMASTHFPLSVQDLVEALAQGSPTDVHDACLSLAIISWDPEGRKIILFNSSSVPRLVDILGRGVSDPAALSGHGGQSAPAAEGSLASLSARFAAMALGNLSLDKPGRESLVSSGQAVPRLVDAIRGGEEETGSFSLLCVGNLFMLPEARSAFVRCYGAVEGLCNALGSPYVMSIRFAVGAVRNLASDRPSRDAILSVMGAVDRLKHLGEHPQQKIRDHAAAALYNLNIQDTSGGGGAPPGSASLTRSMNSVTYQQPSASTTYTASGAIIAPTRPDYREYRSSAASQPPHRSGTAPGGTGKTDDSWLSGSFRNLFSHS